MLFPSSHLLIHNPSLNISLVLRSDFRVCCIALVSPSANLRRILPCPPAPLTPLPLSSYPHRSMEGTPLLFVDTPASLQQMVEELRAARHIAIDLENHNFR